MAVKRRFATCGAHACRIGRSGRFERQARAGGVGGAAWRALRARWPGPLRGFSAAGGLRNFDSCRSLCCSRLLLLGHVSSLSAVVGSRVLHSLYVWLWCMYYCQLLFRSLKLTVIVSMFCLVLFKIVVLSCVSICQIVVVSRWICRLMISTCVGDATPPFPRETWRIRPGPPGYLGARLV